uniref:Secreted protein n=1 Tax=Cyclopterus lumpus TaxID=8103 RepID=A0A8C3A001_CYCLU
VCVCVCVLFFFFHTCFSPMTICSIIVSLTGKHFTVHLKIITSVLGVLEKFQHYTDAKKYKGNALTIYESSWVLCAFPHTCTISEHYRIYNAFLFNDLYSFVL